MAHTKVRWAIALVAAVTLVTAASPISLASSPSPEQENEPAVVRLYYDSRDQLTALAAQYDVWEVQPGRGYAVIQLSPDELRALQALGYRMEIDPERTREARGPLSIHGYPCYHRWTIAHGLSTGDHQARKCPAVMIVSALACLERRGCI